MTLPKDLADREVLVFVGKGGVGKTTTSSAVAMQLAEQGRRTLLVTVDPAKRLKDALGTEIGHRPEKIRPKLWAMMLDPEKVIEEFVREHAPDRNLADHPMYKYISNYMPGINEMLAIGKLIEFRQEKDFDTIVIDTAPTGHALSFLSSPMAIRDVFQENLLLRWALRGYGIYQRVAKSGRMLSGLLGGKENIPEAPDIDLEELFDQISAQVGEIHALLSDHERTTLVIVTLPEKLPVEETIDLHTYVTERLSMHVGYVVVNKVQPDALGPVTQDFDRFREDAKTRSQVTAALEGGGYPRALEKSLVESTEFNAVRRAMNIAHIQDLAARLPQVPRILLPLHRRDISGLERLAGFQAEFIRALAAADRA
jgi:arsenite-transporting ATPase